MEDQALVPSGYIPELQLDQTKILESNSGILVNFYVCERIHTSNCVGVLMQMVKYAI